MKIFTASEYYDLFAKSLRKTGTDITIGKAEIKRFQNGEMHATVLEDITDEECLVVGSVAPPDEQLLAVVTLTSALKRNGTKAVKLFLPYMAYSRQDKFKRGESGGIALIGALLGAAGADEIITIDAHSKLDEKLIDLPFTSIQPTPIFVPVIRELGWDDVTIIAPDEGALARAQAVANALGNTYPVTHLTKIHVDGIIHFSLRGNISKRAIVVDDIIDSGRTLVSTCNVLREKDVKEIAIVVTHGLFTDNALNRLFGLGVKSLFVSDSCPQATAQKHPDIHIVSLTPLLPMILSKSKTAKGRHYENAIS
jgi:ribose-phosphate pyrophosphokinase